MEPAYADQRSKDCAAQSASERAQGRMPEANVRRYGTGNPEPRHHLGPLLVDKRLEEPSEAVKVAAAFHVADDRHERVGIDELLEWHVVEIELP
jgi:hypothetical protein